jgi:hypothetical protein
MKSNFKEIFSRLKEAYVTGNLLVDFFAQMNSQLILDKVVKNGYKGEVKG